MRKVSAATVAVISAIALYFTLFWGFDALRVLTSPTYGLEDVWRSQFVFGIGSQFKLEPMALMKLAAFFGTLKLAVAVIAAVHLVARLRSLGGGEVHAEIFEAALALVILIGIMAAAPALLAHNADVVREQIIQIVLAGLGVALCMVERSYAGRTLEPDEVAVPQHAGWFSPWR